MFAAQPAWHLRWRICAACSTRAHRLDNSDCMRCSVTTFSLRQRRGVVIGNHDSFTWCAPPFAWRDVLTLRHPPALPCPLLSSYRRRCLGLTGNRVTVCSAPLAGDERTFPLERQLTKSLVALADTMASPRTSARSPTPRSRTLDGFWAARRLRASALALGALGLDIGLDRRRQQKCERLAVAGTRGARACPACPPARCMYQLHTSALYTASYSVSGRIKAYQADTSCINTSLIYE